MKKILIFILAIISLEAYSQRALQIRDSLVLSHTPTVNGNGLIDESQIVTGQEAIDSITSMSNSAGIANEYRNINITFSDSIAGETPFFDINDAKVSVTLADGTQKLCAVENNINDTIIGVEYYLYTQGINIDDNTNSLSLYSISGTTATKELESANDSLIFESTVGLHRIYFSTQKVLPVGVYFVGVLPNWSAATTAPRFLGMNITSGQQLYDRNMYIINGVDLNCFQNGQTTQPSTVDLTGVSSSTSLIYFRLLYK